MNLLGAPLRVLVSQFDNTDDDFTVGAGYRPWASASLLKPLQAECSKPPKPFVAALATDSLRSAQLGDVGARRGCSEDKFLLQVHCAVLLPGHSLGLHLVPMSCPLTVTHVLYRAKACPHPGPLPRTGEGDWFLGAVVIQRLLFPDLPPSILAPPRTVNRGREVRRADPLNHHLAEKPVTLARPRERAGANESPRKSHWIRGRGRGPGRGPGRSPKRCRSRCRVRRRTRRASAAEKGACSGSNASMLTRLPSGF